VAGFLVSDLENQAANFIKVFPKDYKKALQKKAAAAKVG
jgi:glutamate synthase (NADPH/NADH) large chain